LWFIILFIHFVCIKIFLFIIIVIIFLFWLNYCIHFLHFFPKFYNLQNNLESMNVNYYHHLTCVFYLCLPSLNFHTFDILSKTHWTIFNQAWLKGSLVGPLKNYVSDGSSLPWNRAVITKIDKSNFAISSEPTRRKT
jgi:hypothetical protein